MAQFDRERSGLANLLMGDAPAKPESRGLLSGLMGLANINGANFGTLSPQEDALREQTPLGKLLAGAAYGMAELPKKVIEASENRRLGGDYDPAPAMEVALNLAGVGMPFATKGAAGIFGGRLAKTADHAALARAEKMTAEGADRAAVYRDTGWFQGADGQWRFEIPDHKSFVRPEALPPVGQQTVPMRNYMEHEALYAAYPELKNLRTLRMPTDKKPGVLGGYDPNARAFFTVGPSPQEAAVRDQAMSRMPPTYDAPTHGRLMDSTLLHEVQHDIQKLEGFAGGSNSKAAGSIDNYWKSAGEVEARNAELRRYLDASGRKVRLPWETASVPESAQILPNQPLSGLAALFNP